MYRAVRGEEQDISALKFKHASLLAEPIPLLPTHAQLAGQWEGWHKGMDPSHLALYNGS